MTTLQPPLIKSDRRRCVLATVEDARRHLKDWDATEDSIVELVEQRYLLAWNIAVETGLKTLDSGRKVPIAREFRILPESITHFEMFAGRRRFDWPEEKTFKRLFEGLKGNAINSAALRLLFNCGPTHVTNLVDAKVLIQAPGTDYRRGPGGAALIALDNVRRFFKSRIEGEAL